MSILLSSASWTPLSWLRDQVNLKYREQASAEEIAKAREERVKQGQGNVFESIQAATPDESQKALPTESIILSPKAKKHTEVRGTPDRRTPLQSLTWYPTHSTNTPPQTSKSPTAN